jgi:hypothetical protein
MERMDIMSKHIDLVGEYDKYITSSNDNINSTKAKTFFATKNFLRGVQQRIDKTMMPRPDYGEILEEHKRNSDLYAMHIGTADEGFYYGAMQALEFVIKALNIQEVKE